MTLLVRLQTLGHRRVGNVVIDARRNLSGFVVAGTLLFLTFIGFSLPFLGLWSVMMVGMVLLLILLFGLLVLFPRVVGWFTRFGTGHFCPGHLIFVNLNGLMCLHLQSVLMILLIGPTQPVSWLSGWLAGGLDLGVGGVSYVELLILYELWAGERLSLEKAHPRYLRPGVQFQCRLFLLVQALIFGAPVVLLVP